MTGTEHRVDVGGTTLVLTEAGPADGPPVLLLHGFPDNRQMWHPQVEALSAAGYRVLAPGPAGVRRQRPSRGRGRVCPRAPRRRRRGAVGGPRRHPHRAGGSRLGGGARLGGGGGQARPGRPARGAVGRPPRCPGPRPAWSSSSRARTSSPSSSPGWSSGCCPWAGTGGCGGHGGAVPRRTPPAWPARSPTCPAGCAHGRACRGTGPTSPSRGPGCPVRARAQAVAGNGVVPSPALSWACGRPATRSSRRSR
jgi:hypothetical protein